VWVVSRLARYIALVLSILPLMSWVSARGRKNIPAKGGVLIYGNHPTFREPHKLFMAVWSRNMTILSMEELFRYFILGPFLRFMGQIPVRRDTEYAKQASDRGAFALRSGAVVGVFPEGERTDRTLRLPDGAPLLLSPFKGGLAYMAQQAPNAVVVPAAVFGTTRRRPTGWRRLLHKPPVRVVFGPPLPSITSLSGNAEQQREAFTDLAYRTLYMMLMDGGYTLD
jgi:1-acyl-sn-glycerol-3-phosphate acyltransferase